MPEAAGDVVAHGDRTIRDRDGALTANCVLLCHPIRIENKALRVSISVAKVDENAAACSDIRFRRRAVQSAETSAARWHCGAVAQPPNPEHVRNMSLGCASGVAARLPKPCRRREHLGGMCAAPPMHERCNI